MVIIDHHNPDPERGIYGCFYQANQLKVYVRSLRQEHCKPLGLETLPSVSSNAIELEVVVADRLKALGFEVHKIGHTYQRDGGIDFLAVNRNSPFPFTIAVQVKFRSNPSKKVGPNTVRELKGVISSAPIDIGVIVTNTAFTPDAQWVARHSSKLIRLCDIKDLAQWLLNDQLPNYRHQTLPSSIEIAEGLVIHLSSQTSESMNQ